MMATPHVGFIVAAYAFATLITLAMIVGILLDYRALGAKLRALRRDSRCTVLFSPSHEELPARELADWVLQDRLPVRFQIQLHKYLWGNAPGK